MSTLKSKIALRTGLNNAKTIPDAQLRNAVENLVHEVKQCNSSTNTLLHVKDALNEAIDNKIKLQQSIEAFQQVAEQDGMSRLELLDNFSVLLEQHEVDSTMTTSYLKRHWVNKLLKSLIGMVLITLGFAMIVLPTPDVFEMYTIFYLSEQDGVTLMDLISLLIVLTGVFFAITPWFKNSNS